jgi:hypothetical protein
MPHARPFALTPVIMIELCVWKPSETGGWPCAMKMSPSVAICVSLHSFSMEMPQLSAALHQNWSAFSHHSAAAHGGSHETPANPILFPIKKEVGGSCLFV